MMIRLAEFSDTPWGRVPEDGDFCGQNFRKNWLVPALAKSPQQNVEVDFSGVEGLGSSFLEEAFGGLIREENFDLKSLKERLKIIPGSPAFAVYERLAWNYIREAEEKKKKNL